MTLTKLNIGRFSKHVEEQRDTFEYCVENGLSDAGPAAYREHLRCELHHTRYLRVSDEWTAAQAPVAATLDELRGMLWTASRARGAWGASDLQIDRLARAAVKAGATMAEMQMSTLTAGEAEAMIKSFAR